MFGSVRVYSSSDLADYYSLHLEKPDTCPFCKKKILPIGLLGVYHEQNRDCHISAFFLCPGCENIFTGVYYPQDSISEGQQFYLKTTLPEKTSVRAFSDNIKKISPKFVEIYQQAENAENAGLNEICGMGYRKALEFLVKDYAIHRNPNNKDSIESSLLSPCINNNIDNSRIKSLATASAWIGNDETHYIRKNEDYDVNQMKSFILSIAYFIDSDLEVEKATAIIRK